jgi:Dynamin GTPase effector domain
MKETEEVASRRKACKEMKELLQRALEILNEVSTALCTDSTYVGMHVCTVQGILNCVLHVLLPVRYRRGRSAVIMATVT